MRSIGFALSGFRHFAASEHNAWIHLAATASAVVLGAVFGLASGEWLWIVLAVGWVWMAEAFNTAIERLADVVTPERNAQIGIVKDVAAAGVLTSAIGASIIGLIIFVPYIRASLAL